MPKTIGTLWQEASAALKNKQYAKAESLQHQACELLRAQDGPRTQLADELEKLADIHSVQFDRCASEYAEVVQIRQNLLSENDLNVLRP
jgi:hypothetical protein